MFVFHNGSSGIHIAGNYIKTNTLVNFIEPSTADCIIEGNKLIVSTVALNSANCNGLVTVIGGVVSASNNVLGGPSPLVSPGQVGLGSTTTTSAGAGSAILPTRPVGFLEVNIGGTTRKVPYYA